MKRLLVPLLGLLALGAVLFSGREQPPAASPPAAAPVAALPLALPPNEEHAASAPGHGAAQGSPEARRQTITASTSRPAIGSEGFGPHIERAATGADATAAWEALQWLRQCDSSSIERQSAEQLRNQGVAPDFMTQRMLELEAIDRACQTVTRAHAALRAPLAEIAMRGRLPGAAAQFVDVAAVGQLTPERRQEAIEGLRRDALAGHTRSLWTAALSSPAWGLSDEERLRYWFAVAQQRGSLIDMGTAIDYAEQGLMGLQSRLDARQIAAAQQAARDLLEKAGQPVKP